jgi:uncharacterized UPF0160 family protein
MTEKNKVTIVTHSSGFHTDDIFAVATLSLLLEKDHEISVVRSRDKNIIEKGDYVVDVGGIYDESQNRFDHHQEGGAGKRENGIPYASFGLVWKKYGEKLSGSGETSEQIDRIIVQPIDAGDNGVQFLEAKIAGLHSFDIGLMTSIFTPTWKEDLTKIDEMFLQLVSYAKPLLNRIINSTKDSEEGKKMVMDSYNNSSDKRLIVLDNSKYPWEDVLSHFAEPLFVIYKNITDDTWSIKGIRNDLFSYMPRKKLPESWGGKTGEDLEKITGVAGGVFCHNARFMAVAKTKEAILKMAEIALKS